MRKLLGLVAMLLLCASCTALPAEERAFAVALGVSESSGTWEVSARVPTYQGGGGYLTLTAQGHSLREALAVLDATAPMQLHLGQLRVVVFSQGVAESTSFWNTLAELAMRREFRLQAQVCVTEDEVSDLLDKLEPATGSRLSKSLDVLLETRVEQGVIPLAVLSDVLRRGERQSWLAVHVALEDTAGVAQPGMDASAGTQSASGTGKVQFGGGWLIGQDGSAHGRLTAAEMQLLALMAGKRPKGTLALDDGTVTLIDASSKVKLRGSTVTCDMSVRYTDSVMTDAGVQHAVTEACKDVLNKLAAAGCDALGVGRQAIRNVADMAAWHELNWPIRYPQLDWQLTVLPQGAT